MNNKGFVIEQVLISLIVIECSAMIVYAVLKQEDNRSGVFEEYKNNVESEKRECLGLCEPCEIEIPEEDLSSQNAF